MPALLRAVCAAGTGVPVAGHDPAVVAAAHRVVRLEDGRLGGDPSSG